MDIYFVGVDAHIKMKLLSTRIFNLQSLHKTGDNNWRRRRKKLRTGCCFWNLRLRSYMVTEIYSLVFLVLRETCLKLDYLRRCHVTFSDAKSQVLL